MLLNRKQNILCAIYWMYKILQEAEAYSEYEEEEYPFDNIEEEAESNVPSSQSDSEMA